MLQFLAGSYANSVRPLHCTSVPTCGGGGGGSSSSERPWQAGSIVGPGPVPQLVGPQFNPIQLHKLHSSVLTAHNNGICCTTYCCSSAFCPLLPPPHLTNSFHPTRRPVLNPYDLCR